MGKLKKFDGYNFLELFYQEMLVKGQASHLVSLSVNARMVDGIYESFGISVTENDLQSMADICFANGWLKHTTMNVGQYGNLQLTTTGLGVVKSKKNKAEQLNNRSTAKKASDYIEEHKGLFLLLGFVIALAGLLIKLFGGNGVGQ